jgi:ADP-ribose pyrophosphatase YjhB (NUDIX family)
MENLKMLHPKTGEVIYYSRSVAVVGVLSYTNPITKDDYFLIVKRGNKEDLDCKGQYCLPCGYLDWDETTEQAVAREVMEETKIKTNPKKWKLLGIDSNPINKQNISMFYGYNITDEELSPDIPKNGVIFTNNTPQCEIEQAEWLGVNTNIDNLFKKEQWAFEHDLIIKKMIILNTYEKLNKK